MFLYTEYDIGSRLPCVLRQHSLMSGESRVKVDEQLLLTIPTYTLFTIQDAPKFRADILRVAKLWSILANTESAIKDRMNAVIFMLM